MTTKVLIMPERSFLMQAIWQPDSIVGWGVFSSVALEAVAKVSEVTEAASTRDGRGPRMMRRSTRPEVRGQRSEVRGPLKWSCAGHSQDIELTNKRVAALLCSGVALLFVRQAT